MQWAYSNYFLAFRTLRNFLPNFCLPFPPIFTEWIGGSSFVRCNHLERSLHDGKSTKFMPRCIKPRCLFVRFLMNECPHQTRRYQFSQLYLEIAKIARICQKWLQANFRVTKSKHSFKPSKIPLLSVLLYISQNSFTVVWLLPLLTYTQIEHAKKPTCLFNAGFCQPMCIPSLMLKEYCVVA